MRVTPIAWTHLDRVAAANLIPDTAMDAALDPTWDGEGRPPVDFFIKDADYLGEFAGRACYKAWDRKNPATATTEGYLKNILDQGHYSVLEHSSVTFYVEHVSRSLLAELTRHRFVSLSVESQRYVDQSVSHPEPVIPPALRGTLDEAALRTQYSADLAAYARRVEQLRREGLGIKQAREAARAFLPNATPVDLVVTGNLRCWRDVLGKRYHVAADAEIREFAAEVLGHLREIAPHSVSDIPDEPWEK